MFKNIVKIFKSIINANNNNKLKKSDSFSYGKFLQDNPKATKDQRKKAISDFLNKTRN